PNSRPMIRERPLIAARSIVYGAACAAVVCAAVFVPHALPAQAEDTSALVRGQTLEDGNELEAAARAYREALARSPASVAAMLGLERVYAELGRSSEILPLLDSALAIAPSE